MCGLRVYLATSINNNKKVKHLLDREKMGLVIWTSFGRGARTHLGGGAPPKFSTRKTCVCAHSPTVPQSPKKITPTIKIQIQIWIEMKTKMKWNLFVRHKSTTENKMLLICLSIQSRHSD